MFPPCTICHSNLHAWMNGPALWVSGEKIQRYFCGSCTSGYQSKYKYDTNSIDIDRLATDFIIYNATLKLLSRFHCKKQSTLNGIILGRIKDLPKVFDMALDNGWGQDCPVVATDTLTASTGDRATTVRYVLNALKNKPLYCDVIDSEDSATITPILVDIRDKLNC